MNSLRYFFTYESELPNGVGFSLFGGWHFLWLFLLSAVCVCYVVCYAKWDAGRQRKGDIALGGALVVWIFVRTAYVAAVWHLTVYELPLHLCSLAGFLCLFHALFRWDWVGQALYAICLPGTVLALVFPDWTKYPPIHFITIEGFLFHIGIVMYVGSQLVSHKIVPDIKKLWKVLLFLLVLVPAIYAFDRRFSANYLFVLRPSAGSPLVWLESLMGNPGYLWGYGALIFLLMVLMDAVYALAVGRGCRFRKRRR